MFVNFIHLYPPEVCQ